MAWRLLLSTHAQSNTTQAQRQEEEGWDPEPQPPGGRFKVGRGLLLWPSEALGIGSESPGRCQVRPVVIPKPHMKDAARELRYSMRARSARVSY
ncbi:hypothetical protein MGG_16449 [Pyricularia oryzae 70-15]|uniref:Uncharacterized protein n=3 Tax=Pyricularia oryzae TaxID=318829 RepID=G4MPF9_PYRO7|nr:uncharacterized protein MGG_16449 [Pyricularia oryzae 70-15]ELQ37864.1 hypothetical protein OOU_Y34scaffold00567g11 [Pyricularia oryzae Y34]KAH8845162.1 hypothetical protein MCOR01_002413 [Pyricularia oryzae]EHA58002.1 hypothetical protein MGG_16449 [Pyricularia oryzae 70-15]KAI6256391.1 hypothetical protein MCOR19_007161 [Pyricularia oryzae]KAI6305948.1 hypothetical protein MCOR34_008279 [Pyricularia oryzae]